MGILKSFLEKVFGTNVQTSQADATKNQIKIEISQNFEYNRDAVDKRTPNCPYCQKELQKIVSRKTKCPHCSQYIYVRTNPQNEKLMVTEQQKNQIDEEWSKINGTYELKQKYTKEFDDEKQALSKKFGKEVSDNDVNWALMNKALLEHAKNLNFGLYRNVRFDMGELLYKENRLKEALNTYLEVCFLDLNGPNNLNGFKDPQFPPFDKTDQFLAPGVIQRVLKTAEKLNINMSDIENLFIQHNSRVHESMKLPNNPEKCWKKLKKEIDCNFQK